MVGKLVFIAIFHNGAVAILERTALSDGIVQYLYLYVMPRPAIPLPVMPRPAIPRPVMPPRFGTRLAKIAAFPSLFLLPYTLVMTVCRLPLGARMRHEPGSL